MKSQVEKVASLLDMESNDVRSIGIWGMAGIGKTEIASVLYQRYRHQFQADCFLGSVGTLYQKNGLTWLAQVVIRKLLGEKMTLTSEHEGKNILKNRLRWKKVLFILDDVNHQEQLEFLVGGREWFGMGSRIILTAIDQHLLISHVGDNVYEVQLLSEDEALELFSRHAFKRKSPERDFEELSSEVVKYADGLPLALKVLGSSFYGRNKEQWGDMIEILKKIPNDDILGKLKIGLNGLNKDEMRIFLDIACLYNHRPRYEVERILKSCGIHMIGVSRLLEKSLLSICRFDWIFEMHSLICQMGQNVSREKYANSRIWLGEEVHDLFTGKLKTKKVESLRIPKGYRFEDDHENHSKVFKKMKSLQVLILDDETICLKRTVTCLPSSVRWIECPNYPSSSLPEKFDPSHLVGLCLQRSQLVELWAIQMKLSNLKHLDLGYSLGLTKTPNFGDMPNLETLDLWKCSNLEEVHPSLGHCRMLTCLNLNGCVKLKKLPKFVTMESLETLDLLQCKSLKEFPEICGDMRRLSRLSVGSPWIRSLPPSLSGLRNLDLRNCEVLESIPDAIRNLAYLLISGGNKLTMLPNSLFGSQQLKNLQISYCSRLVELPISLGVQKMLHLLEINECENLKKLPSSIHMEFLSSLQIFDCPKLDTFPEINGDMHLLEELTLNSTGIRVLPSSIGNLSGLTTLNLKGCKYLVSLPNSLCNVQFCQNINELPGELPPNLKELYADYHLTLKSIRDLVNKCLKLCMLSISWCGHEKSECGTVSNEQVNVMKLLQHFLRTSIQCDFNQRDFLLISFPEVRIPELFDYQFINQERISINLNPSWYTDKFRGFSICYCSNLEQEKLEATLVCKSDPERKHSLNYDIPEYWFESPVMCCIYIPFETLWHASGNKEGKNPNDYYLFEVSSTRFPSYYYLEIGERTCCGIRLEYENKVRRWRRKQRAAQNPKLFSVSRKDEAVTTEIGCSMVLPGPSLASSSRVEENVELIRVCGSPLRKMDDASRKRKRKRNRKKKRKMAGTDETSCSHCTN